MKQIFVFMGVISTLLSFIGCSGQSNKKNDGELSKELQEQIAKSVESYNNRPIYKELKVENINTISDKNLLQAVFDNLSEKLPQDYEKEYETVMSWNESRKAIYVIWALEAEVNNGGFNQFYFNSSGQFYKELPKALRLVGANGFADLTLRANNLFEKENEKITKHQDGTLEGFSKSYEDNPLNKLDSEFYEL
jgi:hypothetical protein